MTDSVSQRLPSWTAPSLPCETICSESISARLAKISVICSMPSRSASRTNTLASRPDLLRSSRNSSKSGKLESTMIISLTSCAAASDAAAFSLSLDSSVGCTSATFALVSSPSATTATSTGVALNKTRGSKSSNIKLRFEFDDSSVVVTAERA